MTSARPFLRAFAYGAAAGGIPLPALAVEAERLRLDRDATTTNLSTVAVKGTGGAAFLSERHRPADCPPSMCRISPVTKVARSR
jgi:hypothetical protein